MSDISESKPEFDKKAVLETLKNPFRSTREFIETLAIAIFLASIFKFFEAEAYVIPTGSMAPTLMGRHKDVRCQACGFPFQVSASEERDRENRPTATQVIGGVCPQCRLAQQFQTSDISYSGDRVLVNKFVGNFRPVQRWDVTVFRSPPDPKTNYIKRFVGLPNENIRIQYGNLYAQPVDIAGNPDGEFQILRKPIEKFSQMSRIVYDNDYQPELLRKAGWPPRWQDDSARAGGQNTDWQPVDDGRNFFYSGTTVPLDSASLPAYRCGNEKPELCAGDSAFKWLRYRHIIPTPSEWRALAEGSVPSSLKNGVIPNNPQLITDMISYNTAETVAGNSYASMGYNWTGDLALSMTMTPFEYADSGPAQMVLELVQGGVRFRTRFDFQAGTVSLEIPSVPEYASESIPFSFQPGKSYRVLFLNFDEQMRVLIDGDVLQFPNEGKYDRLCSPLSGTSAPLPRNRDPNELDLTPASVGTTLPVKVEHLKIMRDLYYIALGNHIEEMATSSPDTLEQKLFKFNNRDPFDHLFSRPLNPEREESLARFLATPALWEHYGNTRSVLIELRSDQYLALGDNSSNSEDCRSWGRYDPNWTEGMVPPCVDRELVIGKAVSVYWPHGKKIPGTRLPFIPNFGKMRKID